MTHFYLDGPPPWTSPLTYFGEAGDDPDGIPGEDAPAEDAPS